MAHDETLWCERGLLVSVRDPDGNVKTIQIDKPFARIGSDYRSDVVLEEGDVPSRAVYLHATDDGVYFRRLVTRDRGGSASSGWLMSDQFIQIGDYRVAASLPGHETFGSQPPADLRRCRYPADEAPRIRIQRVGQKGPAVEHCCRRPLTIVGRSKPSAICLKRPLVSRCHCVLFWDRHDLWAVDLLSANGTLLDGAPIDCRRLYPGQALQLGEIQITYLGVGAWAGRIPIASTASTKSEVISSAVPPPAFPRIAEPHRDVPLLETSLAGAPDALPIPAAVACEAVSLESTSEGDSSELSSLALEMSLYACEERSASGQTIAGAPTDDILQDFRDLEREAASRAQAELTGRLQELEHQRDELLQHVTAISTQLQELAKQEQSRAIEAGQWHDTVASANQQIEELQSSLEALRHESQLEADRLKKRCRRLKKQIHRKQDSPPATSPPLETDVESFGLPASLATVASVGNPLDVSPAQLPDCLAVIATEAEDLDRAQPQDGRWEYALTITEPVKLNPVPLQDERAEDDFPIAEPDVLNPVELQDNPAEHSFPIAEPEELKQAQLQDSSTEHGITIAEPEELDFVQLQDDRVDDDFVFAESGGVNSLQFHDDHAEDDFPIAEPDVLHPVQLQDSPAEHGFTLVESEEAHPVPAPVGRGRRGLVVTRRNAASPVPLMVSGPVLRLEHHLDDPATMNEHHQLSLVATRPSTIGPDEAYDKDLVGRFISNQLQRKAADRRPHLLIILLASGFAALLAIAAAAWWWYAS